MRRLAAFVTLLSLAACAAPSSQRACGISPRATVPVAVTQGVPVMAAEVNGRPAHFLLDTGAQGIVLTEAAVARFGLGFDARVSASVGTMQGQETVPIARLHGLRLDTLNVPDHPVPVLPRALPDMGTGPLDGLFGETVLSRFEVDLDLPHGRMTLYAGLLCPTTQVPPWRGRYTSVPILPSPQRYFIVPVVIDGHEFTGLLDTGTQVTTVSAQAAGRLGLTMAMMQNDQIAHLVGPGPQAGLARLHRFASFAVGGFVVHDPVLMVAARGVPTADVIIGMDWIGHHRLWLSAARQRVFVATSPERTAMR